jgi:hypothetical protein
MAPRQRGCSGERLLNVGIGTDAGVDDLRAARRFAEPDNADLRDA